MLMYAYSIYMLKYFTSISIPQSIYTILCLYLKCSSVAVGEAVGHQQPKIHKNAKSKKEIVNSCCVMVLSYWITNT